MPIYAYRCAACGHAKDVLQKISDAPLVDCPACGAAAFSKQLTAAGFQLKGSGWYATDFKGNRKAGAAKPADGNGAAGTDGGKPGGDSGGSAAPEASAAAAGCGTSCACH